MFSFYSHCDEIISQPLPVFTFREKHIFHNIKALCSGKKYAKFTFGKNCVKIKNGQQECCQLIQNQTKLKL